jgi:methionine biosynthesis protein MetW
MLRGRLPISAALPYSWYDTPNIRIVTISDFEDFCKIQKMTVLKKFAITIDNGENPRKVTFCPDLLGEYGMFLLSK